MSTPRTDSTPTELKNGITFESGSESRAMVAEVSRAWEFLPRLNAAPPGEFAAMRAVLAEFTGQEIDGAVRVLPPFFPDGGRNLRFDRNVFINHGCTAVVVGGIEIDDDVMLGPNVQLISGGRALDPDTRRSGVHMRSNPNRTRRLDRGGRDRPPRRHRRR